MKNKEICALNWKEQYDLSLDLAKRAVKSGINVFPCFVELKYKTSIFNKAKELVNKELHQPELEFTDEEI